MTDYVTHTEFQEFRHEVGERFARVETRLDQTATKEDVASVKAEIHRGIVETQRWMIATVVGLFIGFGGLFMAMTNALKPGAAPAPATELPVHRPSEGVDQLGRLRGDAPLLRLEDAGPLLEPS